MAVKAQGQVTQPTGQPLQRGQSVSSQQRPPPPAVPATAQQTQRRGSKEQSEANSIPSLNNPFSNKVVDNIGPNPPTGGEPQQNPTQNTGRPPLFRRSSQTSNEETKGDEVDDTMRNLRKTFAGIFGDM